MADLVLSNVRDWLKQHAPDFPALPDAVSDAEDEHETSKAIALLEQAFESFRVRDPQRLADLLRHDPERDHLRLVLAHLDPDRRIRLLDWLSDQTLPGNGTLIQAIAEPDETGAGQAVHATIQVLHRQTLLARIFHPDRIKALLAVCQPVPEAEES